MAAPAARPNPPHGQPGHVHGDEGDGDDTDPRQLAAQFDLVQRELQRVDRRLAALEQAMVEAQQAASAVKALSEGSGPLDTLVQLGAGVHVPARIDAGGKVLMPLGAGYYTEDAPAAVADALAARVDAIGRQFQEASEDAERLAQVGASINDRLMQLQG